jgi:hypothetical protein
MSLLPWREKQHVPLKHWYPSTRTTVPQHSRPKLEYTLLLKHKIVQLILVSTGRKEYDRHHSWFPIGCFLNGNVFPMGQCKSEYLSRNNMHSCWKTQVSQQKVMLNRYIKS